MSLCNFLRMKDYHVIHIDYFLAKNILFKLVKSLMSVLDASASAGKSYTSIC